MNIPAHFYTGRPAHTFWLSAVQKVSLASFDPVVNFPFKIGPDDKIATAGSCFAQHIGRHLSNAQLTYLVTESAHPIAPPEMSAAYSYGTFSARTGNIYTSRQLLQLYDRAYGMFAPEENAWRSLDGLRWFDPFRPGVEPGGFWSERELRIDQDKHLAAVREMFETLDYFVFTLGLTECWLSKVDNAAFAVCPGTIAGTFDPERHYFKNLTMQDVLDDMNMFIDRLHSVNAKAKIILTVSPVSLVATAEDRHIVTSTTVSKSILRATCDQLERIHPAVAYFPAYEIITSNIARGRYYARDQRSVTEAGVEHVMRLFLTHATQGAASTPSSVKRGARKPIAAPQDKAYVAAQAVVHAECEEQTLEGSAPT